MRIYFIVLMVTWLTACGAEQPEGQMAPSLEAAESSLFACPPRVQGGEENIICTAQYDPVCADTANGQQTFSNSCRACATVDVAAYKKGACE